MKHMSFVNTVGEIYPQDAGESPALTDSISYWNEGECPPEEWLRWVEDSWGPAGLAMRRGDEMLGFALFGPGWAFPRAGRFSAGLPGEDTVLLASLDGDRRTRKHLLVRMCKDLRHRGISDVEAVASDSGVPHHVSTGFLLENGWRPVRRFVQRSRPYTLARTDLGSIVEVGELARGIIGRVRMPKLKNAPPVPGGAYARPESPLRWNYRQETAGRRS